MLHYSDGKPTHQVGEDVGYYPSAPRKVGARFVHLGADALIDRRTVDGTQKADEDLHAALASILKTDPQFGGSASVGWTQEFLLLEL